MSLSAKRESLARIHGRYQRAGRSHKTRILDEFCATCGYHRKAALRLLNRPLRTMPPKRSGPKLLYEPAAVLPVLKALWLARDQLCSKLLQAALPEWLEPHERRTAPLPEGFRKQLLKISPAQIDRLLRPARVQHPKKGISATRPGTLLRHEVPTRGGPPDTTRPGSVEADTVAHCDDSTEGDYVNSLTFTELYSGWTENRAVWNKSADSVLAQWKELERGGALCDEGFPHRQRRRVPQLGAPPAPDGPRGEDALDAQPRLFARTTTRTANRRTGRTCGSSSGTTALGMRNWCR